tara:strand:+ start:365 stop:526 length:162 start_codon:yes stop_codon:yes gene_type:complete
MFIDFKMLLYTMKALKENCSFTVILRKHSGTAKQAKWLKESKTKAETQNNRAV